MTNCAEIRPHTEENSIREQLKILNRQYDLFTKTKTMHKNNLIALLDQFFPGINRIFSSGPKRKMELKNGYSLSKDFGTQTVSGSTALKNFQRSIFPGAIKTTIIFR